MRAGGHYGAATVVSMPPPRIAVLDFLPWHICGKSQSRERRVQKSCWRRRLARPICWRTLLAAERPDLAPRCLRHARIL
jgi:hypothetical protein